MASGRRGDIRVRGGMEREKEKKRKKKKLETKSFWTVTSGTGKRKIAQDDKKGLGR